MQSRYRWAVLAIGVATQGAFAASSQGLASLGPVLQSHFRISLVETGALLTAVNVGVALTLVGWGVLADRWGERLVLFAGMAGAGAALGLAGLAAGRATAFGLVFGALIVAGMMGSCANSASGRAVMAWFGPQERGRALGVRQMATPLGGAVAAAALPILAYREGISGALFALAAAAAAAAMLSGLFLRTAAGATARPGAVSGPSPLADRRIWRLALAGSTIVAGQLSLISFVVIFFTQRRGWSLGTAAALLALIQFGGALSRVGAGFWSDRSGARLGPMRLLAACGAALFLLVALLAAAPAWALVPVILVTGVVSMSTNGLAFTATGEIAGLARSGTAMGFQNTALFAAGVMGPVGFGAVVVWAGWPAGFATLALLAGLGWLLLGSLVRMESAGWNAPAATGLASGPAPGAE